MPKLTIRRTSKHGSRMLDAWVDGVRQVGFDSQEILPALFPGLEVINGGIMLAMVNLRLTSNGASHYKCFSFGRELKCRSEPFSEIEKEVRSRLRELTNWIASIPVVEEFTIEI